MSAAPPTTSAGGPPVTLGLAEPGGVKRLLGRRGVHALTLTPAEIVVEHASGLRGSLRFAPGAVTVAAVDPGSADARDTGRFPVLHRLGGDRVIPRSEGIDGWVWTARGGSAAFLLGQDAPNVALLLSPPLAGDRVRAAFGDADLADLAKRSPHGEPALVGLLLRVTEPEAATQALKRYGMLRDVTDRDVPPAQRRHLPGDKPADPGAGASQLDRARTSVPPPGVG